MGRLLRVYAEQLNGATQWIVWLGDMGVGRRGRFWDRESHIGLRDRQSRVSRHSAA